MIYNTWRNTYN